MKKIIFIFTLLLVLLPFLFSRLTISSGQVLADNANTEEKEIIAYDYETLTQLSVELNPNENPDDVISLLEPYKSNEENKNPYFYNNLGLAYKNKGRFKDAISAYTRSLKLMPNDPATQYNLAIAYTKHNELSKALNYFLKSSEQRPDHSETKRWIDYVSEKLDVFKAPDTSKLKLIFNKNINVNRQKSDRESRLKIYVTHDGGRIQVLSVDDKIYSYGIDSDTKIPVDYVIIDNDGNGEFEKVINSGGKFGVPSWAYNPD
jgi:tetratricopeptide (TPR) repeat protein